ncbi:hypothetical protein NDU88_004364 [Pleurodeles waltl]|uniref:Uncharacterized protein n=1 Tax=Pleurodeles waltl TaxID=8319 RepID=A0AAV7LJM0_PLEWA|nr:hypothetical protein NDU88_004364 [Pleurodeles waltl]
MLRATSGVDRWFLDSAGSRPLRMPAGYPAGAGSLVPVRWSIGPPAPRRLPCSFAGPTGCWLPVLHPHMRSNDCAPTGSPLASLPAPPAAGSLTAHATGGLCAFLLLGRPRAGAPTPTRLSSCVQSSRGPKSPPYLRLITPEISERRCQSTLRT